MREDVKRVLASVLEIPQAQIADDASVESLEAWDSLRQIRLLMALEERFGVTFDDEEISTLTSIPGIIGAIEQHKGLRSAQ